MLKAIMCLYLGISIVWILGIWKTKYWKTATQLNILFMYLAIGRMISMLMDGFRQAVIFSELLQSLYSDRTQFSIKKIQSEPINC
jgi:hypothetical protein